MKGVRTTVTTTALAAWCEQCGKRWDGVNALAVGARHTAAHGHLVIAESVTTHTYAPALYTADAVRPAAGTQFDGWL